MDARCKDALALGQFIIKFHTVEKKKLHKILLYIVVYHVGDVVYVCLRKFDFSYVDMMKPRFAHKPEHHVQSRYVLCCFYYWQQHFICKSEKYMFNISQ